eukprot:1224146-Rhodomonas_salina.1
MPVRRSCFWRRVHHGFAKALSSSGRVTLGMYGSNNSQRARVLETQPRFAPASSPQHTSFEVASTLKDGGVFYEEETSPRGEHAIRACTEAAAAAEEANALAASLSTDSKPVAIQPPPEMKDLAEQTASLVAKNGPKFEQRFRAKEYAVKFSFLHPSSPFFPFYQQKLAESRSEREDKREGGREGGGAADTMPALSDKEMKEGEGEEEEEEGVAEEEEEGVEKSSATTEASANANASVSKVQDRQQRVRGPGILGGKARSRFSDRPSASHTHTHCDIHTRTDTHRRTPPNCSAFALRCLVLYQARKLIGKKSLSTTGGVDPKKVYRDPASPGSD